MLIDRLKEGSLPCECLDVRFGSSTDLYKLVVSHSDIGFWMVLVS